MTQEKYLIWHIDGGLGKHVAATALFPSIKEKYPDRNLIMVVGHPEIFLNNPNIDRVYFSGNIPYFYDNYINQPNINLNLFRERNNNDTFVDVYYIVLALLGLYVLMHLMRK